MTVFDWPRSTTDSIWTPTDVDLLSSCASWRTVSVHGLRQAGTRGSTIAAHIADAHHRFQWIHPFQDTNGRTGRVIDHGLLWATFGLAGATPDESPIIEYFPDPGSEDAYFEGLLEADLGRPEHGRVTHPTGQTAGQKPRRLQLNATSAEWPQVRH